MSGSDTRPPGPSRVRHGSSSRTDHLIQEDFAVRGVLALTCADRRLDSVFAHSAWRQVLILAASRRILGGGGRDEVLECS